MRLLLYFTLGYTVFEINSGFIRELLNFANKHGIKILSIKVCDCCASVKIYTRDEKKLDACGIECHIMYRRGALHLFKKYKHRAGLIFGLFVFFAALYIAPMFIWEINISGTNRLSYAYVSELLENEGVYIGAFSPMVDRRKVYMNILGGSNDISWLSVNFTGSTANVEIVERDYTVAAQSLADGANIVAKKDGQIIDSDITRGRAVVTKGEIVKKGQMLVSGIYDTAKMGTRYVFSKAEVYASVCDEFIIEIPIENTKCVYGEEVALERSLKMFGKSINIFKNYSIYAENYDTITRDVSINFLGLKALPITVESVVALPYTNEPFILTEEEALSAAKRELYRRLDEETDYTEVLAVSGTHTVENNVLIYRCSVEAVENIAAVAEFVAR